MSRMADLQEAALNAVIARDNAMQERDNALHLLNVVRAILGTPDDMDIRHHARRLVAEQQATLEELRMLRERCMAVPWDALYELLYYPTPQDDALHDARHWYAGACPLAGEVQRND